MKYIPYIILAAALTATGPMYLTVKKKNRDLGIFFKVLTTALIASVTLFAKDKSAATWLFFGGLCVCAAADALLEYKFKVGMVVFLCAHLFYISAYILLGRVTAASAVIFALLFAITLVLVKFKAEKSLKIVGIVYGAVISAMVSLAVPYAFSQGSILFGLGAILFFASDSVIALTLGKRNKLWMDILILVTYWGAQTLIALAAYGV